MKNNVSMNIKRFFKSEAHSLLFILFLFYPFIKMIWIRKSSNLWIAPGESFGSIFYSHIINLQFVTIMLLGVVQMFMASEVQSGAIKNRIRNKFDRKNYYWSVLISNALFIVIELIIFLCVCIFANFIFNIIAFGHWLAFFKQTMVLLAVTLVFSTVMTNFAIMLSSFSNVPVVLTVLGTFNVLLEVMLKYFNIFNFADYTTVRTLEWLPKIIYRGLPTINLLLLPIFFLVHAVIGWSLFKNKDIG